MAKKTEKQNKRRKPKIDEEGQLLPDREVTSILTTGALGPAAADADSLVRDPPAPKPLEPDGLYESGDNT